MQAAQSTGRPTSRSAGSAGTHLRNVETRGYPAEDVLAHRIALNSTNIRPAKLSYQAKEDTEGERRVRRRDDYRMLPPQM